MTLKQRVKAYCDYKNIAITNFERKAGLSNGYFRETSNRMSDDKAMKIQRAFDDLNIDWLRTGNGEMLQQRGHTVIAGDVTGNGNNFVAGNNNHIGYTQDIIEEAKAEIIEAESIPMLPTEISNKVGCDIKAFIEENGNELEGINPSQLLNGADLAEKVLKASMMPTFVPDDIVFVTFLKDKYTIVDGDMYYFALKSKPTMIRKVKIEGNNIRLIAQNPTYGDIITTFDDVRNVAKIVGLLRMTFADFYSEMEEMRRQKEEQINKLIEQNKKSGEREDRLIALLEKKC